jgi:hypothetical protein
VAKKTGKRSPTKKAARKPTKTTARPAAKAAKKTASKTAPKRATAPAAARAAAPAAGAAAGALAERARRIHEEITRSKLTHPDPWRYAPKAREWGDRALTIVDLVVVRGETPSAHSSLAALVAELDADRDFQEARRLF